MSKREDLLKMIVGVVEKNAPNAEVYLYGSRARGDDRKLSDWDVLILLAKDQVSFEFEKKVVNDFYDLELETGEVFSPFIYSKESWSANYDASPLFENIKNEGVRLK